MNENVKRRSPKKLILTVLAVILIIAAAVNTTLAVLSERSGNVTNGFTAAKVDIAIEETFTQGDTVKKDVYIQNNSSTGAYIRAAISVTWQNADGEVYGAVPVLGKDYTLSRSSTGWKDGGDGYYYYVSPVAAGKMTDNLIDECRSTGTAPTGYVLHVEIAAQGIQASPKDAVEGAWGVTVNEYGGIG